MRSLFILFKEDRMQTPVLQKDKIENEERLLAAVRDKNYDVVKRQIDGGTDVNLTAFRGLPENLTKLTPLHMAVRNKDLKIVELLLDKGADPLIEEKDAIFGGRGVQPIEEAIKGYAPDIVKKLLKDERVRSRIDHFVDEAPLLHIALDWRSVEAAKLLLENGADVNIVSPTLGSPLYIAIKREEKDMVDLLLQKGADPDITIKEDKTPLDFAKGDIKKLVTQYSKTRKRKNDANIRALVDKRPPKNEPGSLYSKNTFYHTPIIAYGGTRRRRISTRKRRSKNKSRRVR